MSQDDILGSQPQPTVIPMIPRVISVIPCVIPVIHWVIPVIPCVIPCVIPVIPCVSPVSLDDFVIPCVITVIPAPASQLASQLQYTDTFLADRKFLVGGRIWTLNSR